MMSRAGMTFRGAMLLVLGLLVICVTPGWASLKGGCAKIEITPPVGVWMDGYGFRTKPSASVFDPLYARAMVLNDGERSIAIVSCDLLWVPLDVTNLIRKAVVERTDIEADCILVSGTHTHFGPKISDKTTIGPDVEANSPNAEYGKVLVERVAEVVVQAYEGMVDVRFGMVKGLLPEVAFNRRTLKPDGSAVMTWSVDAEMCATRTISTDAEGNTIVGFTGLPDLKFGPVDPELSVLRIEDPNGAMVGSLVNYACHAVSGSRHTPWDYAISADFPGVTTSAIERVESGVCLFATGTCGDLVPLQRGYQGRYQVGKAIAGEALRLLQFMKTTDDVKLSGARKTIHLPLRKSIEPGHILAADPNAETLETEIQVLRIGDVYLLGLPGEILVELGLQIKQQVASDKLIIIELSNDACGYVCHTAAYEQGAYEPTDGTNLEVGAGEMMVKEAVALIEAMR